VEEIVLGAVRCRYRGVAALFNHTCCGANVKVSKVVVLLLLLLRLLLLLPLCWCCFWVSRWLASATTLLRLLKSF